MLSILIPIYNWNVVELVENLHQQCIACNIVFEIICFDDGSKAIYKTENHILSNYDKVYYKELTKNLGRAKIRNALGAAAKYDYLLFMDADAKVVNEYFIQQYIAQLSPKTLLYGGCIYKDTPPRNQAYLLHYHYGKNREETTTEERKISPYKSFKTFNFVIPKTIFSQIRFEESITQYGHEDTLFGNRLEELTIPILHIDNPLEHLGLESTATFLRKQEQALDTLYQLYQQKKHPNTRLIQAYEKCYQLGIQPFISRILQYFNPFIKKQLYRKEPNIFFLDLYKLNYWLLKFKINT